MEGNPEELRGQQRAGFRSRGETLRSRLRLSGDLPPPAVIDGNSGEVASYYLGHRHHLIHRHTESIAINPDQTARWTLKIDFELPEDEDAHCGEHNGETIFLFPLLFLRKAQGRTGFEARDEQGATIPLLNRELSDEISGRAAAKAALRLIGEARAEDSDLPNLPENSLRYVFVYVCKWRPYIASVILNQLKHELDEDVRAAWEEAGLLDDLELLVDHSLVWVPLRGLPGERRVIEVAHDTELSRRPLLRWHFGELKVPNGRRRWWRRWRRRKQMRDPSQVLDTGQAKYGRIATRVSLSVLGERLAKPLGWMPIEFDFPTIYTRRCDSYHFEMTCPSGLKNRGLRIAVDKRGGKEGRDEEVLERSARMTMRSRAAHMYLRGGRSVGDVVLKATVGISSDAFPILWVLMGAITTIMLWSLVAFNPSWLVDGDPQNRNEIAAGVLLIVPALLGAVIVGSDEKAESKLLSGARILLLITGLCSAASAAVFTDIKPLSDKPQATWAICATVATASIIPMVTSWLLSLDAVWRARETLHTVRRQYSALIVMVALAFGIALLLPQVGGETIFRASLASCLLLLSVSLALLASNRLPVALEANRKFVSVGAMLAAFACLVLGCVELQRIFAPDANWQVDVESVERWIFIFAPIAGLALWVVTLLFGARPEELSIAPIVGKGLIVGERIRELRQLREINPAPAWGMITDDVKSLRLTLREGLQGKVVERAGSTEGDWSAAQVSSTELPPFAEEEFDNLMEPKEQGGHAISGSMYPSGLEQSEVKAIAEREGITPLDVELALLKNHVDQLLEAGGRNGQAQRAGLLDRFRPPFRTR